MDLSGMDLAESDQEAYDGEQSGRMQDSSRIPMIKRVNGKKS